MKVYCEELNGKKRFATQGSIEGEWVVVQIGSRKFRLAKEDLERGLTVMVRGWNFEKYSTIEHDSKLHSKQRW